MKFTIICFANGFWYDDDTYISAGQYPFTFSGINNLPMIFACGEWLDLYDLDALEYEVL